MPVETEPSLYERLGGAPALALVVDDFYARVLSDADLAPFFAGVNMPRLKARQVDFLTTVFGGPRLYRGPSMRLTHSGMGITSAHFDAVAAHLVGALRWAGVPELLVEEVVVTVLPLANDIVNSGVAGMASTT